MSGEDGGDWAEKMRGTYDNFVEGVLESCSPEQAERVWAHVAESLARDMRALRAEDVVGGLGRRIRAAREAHCWSQRELARRADTSQQAIARWEAGEVEPRIAALASVAEACGVPLAYLLGAFMAEDSPDDDIAGETLLVLLYRAADEDGRKGILQMAEILSE